MKKLLCILSFLITVESSIAESNEGLCGYIHSDTKDLKILLSGCEFGDTLHIVSSGRIFNQEADEGFGAELCQLKSIISNPSGRGIMCKYRGSLRTLFPLTEGDNGWCDLGVIQGKSGKKLDLTSIRDCREGNVLRFHGPLSASAVLLFCKFDTIRSPVIGPAWSVSYCEYRGSARVFRKNEGNQALQEKIILPE